MIKGSNWRENASFCNLESGTFNKLDTCVKKSNAYAI